MRFMVWLPFGQQKGSAPLPRTDDKPRLPSMSCPVCAAHGQRGALFRLKRPVLLDFYRACAV